MTGGPNCFRKKMVYFLPPSFHGPLRRFGCICTSQKATDEQGNQMI